MIANFNRRNGPSTGYPQQNPTRFLALLGLQVVPGTAEDATAFGPLHTCKKMCRLCKVSFSCLMLPVCIDGNVKLQPGALLCLPILVNVKEVVALSIHCDRSVRRFTSTQKWSRHGKETTATCKAMLYNLQLPTSVDLFSKLFSSASLLSTSGGQIGTSEATK